MSTFLGADGFLLDVVSPVGASVKCTSYGFNGYACLYQKFLSEERFRHDDILP